MSVVKVKYTLVQIDGINYKITEGSLVGIPLSSQDASNNQQVLFGVVEKNRDFLGGDSDVPDAWKAVINGTLYTFNRFGIVANIENTQVYLPIKTDFNPNTNPQHAPAVEQEELTGGEGGGGGGGSTQPTSSDAEIETRASVNPASETNPQYTPSLEPQSGGGANGMVGQTGVETNQNVVAERLYLKDHFAIAAMQAMINNIPNPFAIDKGHIAVITEQAYAVAQSMYEKSIDLRPTMSNKFIGDTDQSISTGINFDRLMGMNPSKEIDDMYGRLLYNQAVFANRTFMAMKGMADEITKSISKLASQFNPLRIDNTLPIYWNPQVAGGQWEAIIIDDTNPRGWNVLALTSTDPDVSSQIPQGGSYESLSIDTLKSIVENTKGAELYYKKFNVGISTPMTIDDVTRDVSIVEMLSNINDSLIDLNGGSSNPNYAHGQQSQEAVVLGEIVEQLKQVNMRINPLRIDSAYPIWFDMYKDCWCARVVLNNSYEDIELSDDLLTYASTQDDTYTSQEEVPLKSVYAYITNNDTKNAINALNRTLYYSKLTIKTEASIVENINGNDVGVVEAIAGLTGVTATNGANTQARLQSMQSDLKDISRRVTTVKTGEIHPIWFDESKQHWAYINKRSSSSISITHEILWIEGSEETGLMNYTNNEYKIMDIPINLVYDYITTATPIGLGKQLYYKSD